MKLRSKTSQRAHRLITTISIAIICLTSCSYYRNNIDLFTKFPNQDRTVVQNGMVAISRSAPSVGQGSSDKAFGFIPASLHAAPTGSWLVIDRSSKSLALMKGDQVVSKLKGEGFTKLTPGVFKVKHKQRSPLWYAPDGYFNARNMAIPAEGDKARFRRGALGDFVVFADQDTPIHSGPIWLDEIGGVKMDEAELSKIYYSLEVGSAIEVK
jgi:hypothetical protein